MAFPQPRRRSDFQVAIICALPLEYDAAALAFDQFWSWEQIEGGSEGRHTYRIGRIGRHNAVLALLPGMGKVNATSAATSFKATFDGLKLAILTGICGGVPRPKTSNDEIMLGDVAVSKGIVQYDLARQYPSKLARKDTLGDNLGRPNKGIRTLLATFETQLGLDDLQYQAAQALSGIQQKAIDTKHRSGYNRPTSVGDVLFEPDYVHRHRDHRGCGCCESNACEEAIRASCEEIQCDTGHCVSRRPLAPGRNRDFQIHIGQIGSGDTVMKSGLHRDGIAGEHGLIAFEMEAAGIWDEIPCIVTKGVCDYADSHKNKSWQNFAAATGAATMKAIIGFYTPTKMIEASSPWFIVPYGQNPDFVSRTGILNQIKRLFGHDQSQTLATRRQPRVALHGLGGIGKTQIALAYVYWLREAYPDISVFWVHASNTERFHQAYLSIAQECHIPGCNDPKADVLPLVKAWLEKNSQGRWVMVIDNADDTEVFFPTQPGHGHTTVDREAKEASHVGRYIPECENGSVLITTRNKQAALKLTRGKKPLEIATMTDEEANQLLCAALEGETISAEETSELSARLEYLPLALAQAAAFILENDTSIQAYIQILDEGSSTLVNQLSEPFEAIGRDSEIPHAVTATWMVSFEQIKRSHGFASNVLSFISLLDRQAIPEAFVVDFYRLSQPERPQASPTVEVIKSLGILVSFSFIKRAEDGTYDMHRLVQLVTQKWLLNERRFTEFAQQALEVLSDAYPFGEYETRELCSRYFPHAKAVLDHNSEEKNLEKAKILHSIGGYFAYIAQYAAAEHYVLQSVTIRTSLLGEEHPDTLISMNNLASTYRNQGRWDEAEEIGVQVLDISKRVLGEEHPDTLRSMNNLALTHMNQGRWNEAEEIGVQVLDISKRVLGEEHPDTLISMSNLALTHMNQGRWEEAEQIGVQVLEISKRVCGEEHPNTLISMNNLASTYWNQGRWDEAEELELQVLDISKRVLGEEHPDTLRSMHNLAHTWKEQGRQKDALQLMRECLGYQERCLGSDHPHTKSSSASILKWEEEDSFENNKALSTKEDEYGHELEGPGVI